MATTQELLQRIENAVHESKTLSESRFTEVDRRLVEISDRLKTLNGTVRDNCTSIELLKQAGSIRQRDIEDLKDLTANLPVLTAEQARHGVNWEKVWRIVETVLLLLLTLKMGLK